VPEGKTRDDVIAMLSYFDVANLAAWIKCPTYIGLSVGDLTVHAMGGLAAYRNLTQVPDDQKGFYPGPSHLHANSAEGIARHRAEFDRIAGRPLS
jgi:cephalosporin-C deacetylase-like acetyl esterase